jgi:glycosyltransferase involved in cell wall biosynthesis
MTHSKPTKQKILLSVIAPFYNEQDNVAEFFERINLLTEKIEPKYIIEIVAVNDGSRDQTLVELVKMTEKYPKVCVVDLSRNFGKEAALSAGLQHVTGQVVVTMDSDLQHPPEKIPEMLRLWEDGYEVVLPRRANRDDDRSIQRVTANFFYKIHNAISDINIPPDVGDFRLMDIAVVKEVNKLPENRRFMKGLFAWVGFNAITIEYTVGQRTSGKSNFNLWRLWNFALEGITSFSTTPLRIWTYIGLLVSLTSMMYALYLTVRTLIYGIDTPGYLTLMVAILFLGGIQLIGIGVLGEYMGRTYSEVKNRGIFVTRKIYRSDDKSN